MGVAIGRHRLSRRLGSGTACAGVAMLMAGFGVPGALGAPAPRAALSSAAGRLALKGPSGLAVDAGELWVTNRGGNSVTEINPSTHKRMRTIASTRDGFAAPVAILAAGRDLFIANKRGGGGRGSVTEIRASNGAWVRTISAGRDGFDLPVALARRHQDLFVVNKGGSITELNTTTGALIRRISGHRYHFVNPVAATVAGADLWVADDSTANTVTEINAGTGRLVRTVSGQGLSGPDGIAFGMGHVWVADSTSYSATEVDAANGAVITTVSGGAYGFNHPSVTMVNGGSVYVVDPPGNTPMVTKFSATDGTAAWFECNTNQPSPNFVQPSALAFIGTHLFVASETTSRTTLDGGGKLVGNSITELSLTDGGNAVAWMTNRSL